MSLLRLYADSRRSGNCRGCGAAIDWWETIAAQAMPMDVTARILDRDWSESAERWIVYLSAGDSHWATCPERARFKTPRRSRSDSPPAQIALFVD
jgi:hypothetical protein